MEFNFPQNFQVIVVGGGHAGTEAALAAARLGASTLLLTHNIETLGQMSCNPAIGGIGKGHLVKEIDALGGIMALAADKAGIQFRTLNSRKGPAVRATRAQSDRNLYKQAVREKLELQPNLWIFQQSVDNLLVKGGQVVGVKTQMGVVFYSSSVVLTVGTFLAGKIHIGQTNFQAGRAGCPPANALANFFQESNFKTSRLKTGTPPRIAGNSIDFSKLQEQPGDLPTPRFSALLTPHPQQISCHITHTNEKTHKIINNSLSRSPLFAGDIEGVGPRYCPSIEDKVVRFADKESHQIFLEPEGLALNEYYPNGISTSLPFDVQLDFVRSMQGLENAHITRPGYAIEYDFFDPRQLEPTLQTKLVKGLFFAGQINGTTGYEEAAAQGLIAGLNAAKLSQGEKLWYPSRSEAYIGVLIDDLITHGTLEPYRMFTSRAEYRLLLREDNADLRLSPIAYQLGLLDENRWKIFTNKQQLINKVNDCLESITIRPEDIARNLELSSKLNISQGLKAKSLLVRPEVTIEEIINLSPVKQQLPQVVDKELDILSPDILEQAIQQVGIQVKYQGYINRQQQEALRVKAQENKAIPTDFDYKQVSGLSAELTEKLMHVRPSNLAVASRIPGMTPAAISLLLVYIKKHKAVNCAEVAIEN